MIVYVDPATRIAYTSARLCVLEIGDAGFADGDRWAIQLDDGSLHRFRTRDDVGQFCDRHDLLLASPDEEI